MFSCYITGLFWSILESIPRSKVNKPQGELRCSIVSMLELQMSKYLHENYILISKQEDIGDTGGVVFGCHLNSKTVFLTHVFHCEKWREAKWSSALKMCDCIFKIRKCVTVEVVSMFTWARWVVMARLSIVFVGVLLGVILALTHTNRYCTTNCP